MDAMKAVPLLLLVYLWGRYRALGFDVNETNPVQFNEEKRLLDKLMLHYDRDVRPIRNASRPIVIKLSITLTQIFDMDEKNQVLTTNVWLDQEWSDELLLWDPADYGGLDTIRLPCERIWLPDIVLYNNADDYTRGYMASKAMVRSDGNVFWPPPTKFRSTCPVDVTYFPFDDQRCILKLGSWMYDGFQVDVTNRTSGVDLSNYVPSGEWELLEARIVRNVMFYSCCPEPFPDVTITLLMRRKTLYYMYNVVLPCMMMSVLTLLVFCLPPDSGEKIALGITVLLAFSVFMLAIAEKMPETSESIPLIGIYLTAVMAITSISVIMTVIVLNFHHRGPLQKEVPPWMRRLVLHQLAACTCVKTQPLRGPHESAPIVGATEYRTGRSKPVHECPSAGCATYTKMDALRLNIEGGNIKSNNDGGGDLYSSSNESLDNIINMNDLHAHTRRHGRSRNNHHHNNHHHHLQNQQPQSIRHCKCAGNGALTGNGIGPASPPPQHTSASGHSGRVQDEILRSLRHLMAKQEQDEYSARVVNEWRQIATVVDRFLFWIFLVGTAISSVSFLVIVPLERRGWYG